MFLTCSIKAGNIKDKVTSYLINSNALSPAGGRPAAVLWRGQDATRAKEAWKSKWRYVARDIPQINWGGYIYLLGWCARAMYHPRDNFSHEKVWIKISRFIIIIFLQIKLVVGGESIPDWIVHIAEILKGGNITPVPYRFLHLWHYSFILVERVERVS